MRKEKKKDILVGILLIIILILSGVLLFLVLTKEEKTEKKTIENKVTEQKEDFSNISSTLLNIIDNYKIDILDLYGTDIVISTIPTNEQLNAMKYSLSQNGTSEIPSIPKSIVDDYFKTVYNVTPSQYPDIICKVDNKTIYSYDKDKQEYVTANEHSHNEYLIEALSKTVTNIIKENNTYIVDVAKIYEGNIEDASIGQFYSDGTYKNVLKDYEQFFDGENYDETGAINYFNNNKDKAKNFKPQYRYTFKKTGDNYYITKYQVIK